MESTLNIILILKMVDSAPAPKEYSCRKCRVKLFSESDLVTHNSKEKKFKAQATKMNMNGQQECMSYYIDPQEWMNIPEDETV